MGDLPSPGILHSNCKRSKNIGYYALVSFSIQFSYLIFHEIEVFTSSLAYDTHAFTRKIVNVSILADDEGLLLAIQ